MGHYLVQFTYTPEAWAAQLKHPANRARGRQAARGGASAPTSRPPTWRSGEYDVVLIIEAPATSRSRDRAGVHCRRRSQGHTNDPTDDRR